MLKQQSVHLDPGESRRTSGVSTDDGEALNRNEENPERVFSAWNIYWGASGRV
jgi:hypothetical protein